MKRSYITTAIVLVCCLAAMAQVPHKLKYQGVARDLAGLPMVNQNISLKVSILQDSTSGTALYVETFATATNAFGLFNVNIGTGSVVSGNFSTIPWGQHDYYQLVEMDPAGGNSYVFVGVSQLMSVPYALYSEHSDNCGFTNMQVFYFSGSFTIPDNVKKIMVEVWGAGGGGGLYSYPSAQSGGGGGGYGKEIFTVTSGTNYAVTVGTGGTGTTTNGGDGGTTSFGTLISASGGGGGHAGGGYGGNSTAAFSIMGQDAYIQSASSVKGGSCPNGGTAGEAGIAGREPGGGGGGGYLMNGSHPGGNGGNGRVVVWW